MLFEKERLIENYNLNLNNGKIYPDVINILSVINAMADSVARDANPPLLRLCVSSSYNHCDNYTVLFESKESISGNELMELIIDNSISAGSVLNFFVVAPSVSFYSKDIASVEKIFSAGMMNGFNQCSMIKETGSGTFYYKVSFPGEIRFPVIYDNEIIIDVSKFDTVLSYAKELMSYWKECFIGFERSLGEIY